MYNKNLCHAGIALVALATGSTKAKDVDSEAIANLLKAGQLAISTKRFNDAITKCQAGIEMLGDSYSRSDVTDDTGLKLVAAEMLRRQGKSENASSMYCGMLAIRLEQFKR